MYQSYSPRFPPVDVSITVVINRYSSASMSRVEEHLKRIFDYFFTEGFIRCSVYFRLDRDRAEFRDTAPLSLVVNERLHVALGVRSCCCFFVLTSAIVVFL